MTRLPTVFARSCKLGWPIVASGFVADIVGAYGGLRASMRNQIERGNDEPRLMAYLAFGCFVIFLSFLPRLLATDLSGTDQSIAAGIIIWFFVVMFFAPLMLYGIAAISHMIAKGFGAKGPYQNARHAIAWMLVVLSPALIVKAMLSSVFITLEVPLALSILNAVLALIVLRIWGAFLAECEGFTSSLKVSSIIAAVFLMLGLVLYAFS